MAIRQRQMALISQILWLYVALTSGSGAAVVPSSACVQESPPNHIPWTPKVNETRMFNIDGRDVHITVPPNYSQDAPKSLIFAYHDREMSIEELRATSRLSDPEANSDAIIVYPKAVKDSWQSDIRPLRPGQERKSKNSSDDVDFTLSLLEDLQQVLCFDTANIHATGFGTGGGMMHMLACRKESSTRFASFASIGGGYGRDDDSDGVWSKCTPGRKPVPILEIHGDDDKMLPYVLNTWEDTKRRLAVPSWLDRWSELNGCGEESLEDFKSETEKRTTYTRLEGGGVVSKGDQYGTGIVRTVKACPRREDDSGKPITKVKPLKLATPDDKEVSILHFKLPDIGHVWPRQQFERLTDLQDDEERAEQEKRKGKSKINQKLMFDTTVVVFDWFNQHPLPVFFADKWKEEDEAVREQRRAMKESMRQSGSNKEIENSKLLEHIEKMVKSGQMTEEQAEQYKAKIAKKPEHEYAGFGPQDQEEDADEEPVAETPRKPISSKKEAVHEEL